ncbi:ImmA/IrrE family metallo-endopeptidase [Leptospira ilyithenensis]|uniref:ImmA/IrrE family metallo-endopeptidase n=1 Tax=Leptospira ilyithenensis TaxID=2484901 RepID=A0A4R9LR41_9LEPT|nr:ImmA/IrrE family metallo-endopeptidase [Leptospira ilyithenensis]TGN09354.1 ImmA/IrrE family metallo-endopeptidase [Leptospira ilyithenensis]
MEPKKNSRRRIAPSEREPDFLEIPPLFPLCGIQDNHQDVSGILNVEGNLYSIVVDQDHHDHRKRFTIAHELGHYILHKPESIHVDKMSFYRSPLSSTALDRLEIEAN